MIKWLAWIVAVPVILIAAIWAIGSRLPVEHRASASRTLAVDADAAWSRIASLEAWPSWRGGEVEVLSDASIRVTENGESVRYRVERPADRTLVTEIDTSGLPYGGRWTWTVEPTGDSGAVVTIVEEGEVYDPFFRFFSRFVFGHESTMQSVLDHLEASFGPAS